MTMYDKIDQMKPEQENHWFDLPELSYWGERYFAELSVAQELATSEEFSILEDSVDLLYQDFLREHALTDSACQRAEVLLLPFSQRAKEFNLHCVAHAHIDMDWLWGLHETVDVVLNTFQTMLDLMDEYEDFTFSQSQCAVYRMTEFFDPALFRRMKKRIQEGRFEFAGSSWVELDKNMPNLESMARQILYTKQYLHSKFGIPFKDIQMDFHPDTFGHSASIPEIFRAAGIKYFYHCRGLDGIYLYRWRGNSGAEILTLNEPLWYNDSIRPMYLHQVPRFCKEHGIRDMMKIYGVGDHGGGPTRKDIEMILDMRSWPVAPTVFFSTYSRYFAALEPYKEQFPVLTGELGPTFTGCYTSQSQIKQANRVAEDRLFAAEAVTAFAVKETGIEDFNRQFQVAWEHVLFNQFHDILPGTNIPESKAHALGAFEEALGCVMAASGASLRALADAIDTSCFETPRAPLASCSEGGGVGQNTTNAQRFRLPGTERGVGKTRLLHFFNPTGFNWDGVLEATVWDWPGDPKRMEAFGPSGQPLDITAKTIPGNDAGHVRTDILVKTCIPALGYTTVRIEEGSKTRFSFCELPPDPRVIYYPPLVLENDLVRVTFNEEDLSVSGYYCKKTGKELLGSEGGRFILYRERTVPKGGCAWLEGVRMSPKNLHVHGVPILKEHVSNGLLRSELRYELQYGESVLSITARLHKGSPVLELDVAAKWLEKADAVGTPTLAFRLHLPSRPEYFLSDSQIGLERRRPEPMHDRCGRNFFHAEGGMTLLTDCKYGYRGYDDRLEVSLLRASSRPDPLPETGQRHFRIGVTHCQEKGAALKQASTQFAIRDLPYASNRAHAGTLPLEKRMLTVHGAQVAAIKLSEDKTGWIVRLASFGREDQVQIHMADLKRAWLTDLNEECMTVCQVDGESVSLDILANQVLTVKLEY